MPPPTDHFHDFEAPDCLTNKVLPWHDAVKIPLIGLNKSIEQGIDFAKIQYSLSDLWTQLWILFYKFIYVGCHPTRLGIYEFVYSFLKDLFLLVIEWSCH